MKVCPTDPCGRALAPCPIGSHGPALEASPPRVFLHSVGSEHRDKIKKKNLNRN